MNHKHLREEKKIEFKDFISYEPQDVRFLPKEVKEVVEEHTKIIIALRNKNMTVKEIHNLFYDIEKQKHTYTIKTIYRHLEKLEEAGVVTIAGHRITKGARIFEKLYCRTANVFISAEPDEERVKILNIENGNTYSVMDMFQLEMFSQKLEILMKELFELPELDSSSFYEFIQIFYEAKLKTITELYDKAKENEKITQLLAKSTFREIDSLTNLMGILASFLRYPELLNNLKDLFSIHENV